MVHGAPLVSCEQLLTVRGNGNARVYIVVLSLALSLACALNLFLLQHFPLFYNFKILTWGLLPLKVSNDSNNLIRFSHIINSDTQR